MSTHAGPGNDSPASASVPSVDMKLEVIVIPVSDVDRAKGFYSRLGWRLDADRTAGTGFRLIQFTPPASGCSVQFGVNHAGPAWFGSGPAPDRLRHRGCAPEAGCEWRRRERGISLCNRDRLQVSRRRRPRQRPPP
jgi:hypothetical protein